MTAPPDSIDVYFDYRSPFAYLACEVLPRFAEHHGTTLAWKPVDLLGLSNYAGGLPYSPVKRAYVAVDAARSAEFHGVPIRLPKPHPVESQRALQLASASLDDERFALLHAALFRAAWRDQRDLADLRVLAKCIAAAGGPVEAWLARSDAPEAVARVDALTAEAEACGVFGVPSMLLRGELFWGLDSLPTLAWRLGRSLPRRVRVEAHAGLRLARVAREHAEAMREMAQEFGAEGDARFDPLLADAEDYFGTHERFEAGRDLPPNRVQQTSFLLFRGDRLLGSARLRHRLIPVLERDGGNLGYEIRRSERSQGYGTALLGLVLEEARRIGLDRVLLTTERENAASIRVIEKNGGIADGTSISPNTGKLMVRFWIAV